MSLEKRETEQQSQLLTEEEEGVSTAAGENTSLNKPLERETNDLRCEIDETERDGKESITASLGRDHERDEDIEAAEEDQQVEGRDEDVENGDGADPDSRGGNEKMMWEREGVGYRSIPRSLAIDANL